MVDSFGAILESLTNPEQDKPQLRILDSGFLSVRIDDILRAVAESRNLEFAKYGKLGTNRDDPLQRMIGYLAEAAVSYAFPRLSWSDELHSDLVLEAPDGSLTYDVKSGGINVSPQPPYHATLYEEYACKPVDYYVFCRTARDQSRVWICGVISRSDFLATAAFRPVGYESQNFVYDCARYELSFDRMTSPSLVYPMMQIASPSDRATLRA